MEVCLFLQVEHPESACLLMQGGRDMHRDGMADWIGGAVSRTGNAAAPAGEADSQCLEACREDGTCTEGVWRALAAERASQPARLPGTASRSSTTMQTRRWRWTCLRTGLLDFLLPTLAHPLTPIQPLHTC